MKLKMSRCLSCIMTVLLLSLLCVPAFASSGSTYNQKIGFWDWLAGKDSILPDFIGYAFGKICPKSDDGYHHANSYVIDYNDGYYKCICSYCGAKFDAYESDLQQSYNDYVGTLPATGYNSAGNLIWHPSVGDLDLEKSYARWQEKSSGWNREVYLINLPHSKTAANAYDNNALLDVYFNSSSDGVCMYWRFANPYLSGFSGYFYAPVSGMYRQIPSLSYSYGGMLSSGKIPSSSEYYYPSSSYSYLLSGGTLSAGNSFEYSSFCVTFLITFYFPFYEIIPDTVMGDIYSVTTRPTTITGGNYGIVGDNGQITKVTNNTSIINETNNTYYNPATGTTETVNSWSYDYSDRSYNITLETGDTVTVTYGDENITIIEGDTVYNIYYIIDGSGSDPAPGPSGSGHVHQWYQTGAVQGNCVTATQRTYTCSECGQQYTETDPAPGHTWHIIQEVSTKYDDSGKLIQEGYTIYECERCGEQYKSTNDAGPPPSGGGSSGGNSGSGGGSNIFSGIFGIIWDFFTFFFDFFSDFIVGGIKGFISALLDVGSDFFAILNPFDWGY